MSNDAKRASNARYLEKFRSVSVRIEKEKELPAIEARAEAEGLSLSAYMLQAAKGSALLRPDVLAKAEKAAQLQDMSTAAWIENAINKQAEVDAGQRRLQADLQKLRKQRETKEESK